CAAPAVPAVRFANAPAAAAVDDRRDVPRRPAPRTILAPLHMVEGYMSLVTRPLGLPRARRALGVNALDEVPDSTWFTNRIGVRDLSPDEIRAGAGRTGSPEPHKPWTVHSTKIGGAAVGFIVSDARGERFLVKLEKPGFPELETGADAIASRLLWAAGYNVPEDHVVYLRPDDLVLAPDARIKDLFGHTRRLERAELERRLALGGRGPDGRMRALASRMLDGASLGGHPGEGVRADDPNDRIPHELRRDLRGAYAFFAWLDLTDVKEDNTLDMWVADPADPRRHYVKHYLIDFDKSLGSTAMTSRDPRTGLEYRLDLPTASGSLVTLGLSPRAWERRVDPALPGVGLFEAEAYRPGGWKPGTPAYLPFRTADDLDKLWASRILIRFTRAQLRAAVDAARFSDPRAADHVTDTLIARQRATARHWFWQASPLDRFAPAGGALCFDDLLLVHGLAPVAAATRYTVTAYDRRGRSLGASLVQRAAAGGRTCAGPLPLGRGGGDGDGDADGYTIVRIDTARLHFRGATYVHLAGDPRSGAPRVIGIWRP
ncbi:MAG TPA: hypothetical protein VK932_23510, partial [Kofleriaceae bacterium]|nr:hypothetical protein [Kofleriaceae bacterium]